MSLELEGACNTEVHGKKQTNKKKQEGRNKEGRKEKSFPTRFAEVEDQSRLSLFMLCSIFIGTYNCKMSLNFVSYSGVAKET